MDVMMRATGRLAARLGPTALLLVLCLTGCSDEDPVVPDPADEPYPWPESADELMDNVRLAYDEMDGEAYGIALHDDFKFIFIGHARVWSRATDIASMERMFGGLPGENPDGTYRAPVQGISVVTLTKHTPWQAVPGDDPDFPNSAMAVYEVLIVFTLEGGENTITVDSDQEFYVEDEEVDTGDGTTRTRYQLVGQRDVAPSYPKANEAMAWGEVKSLFDPDPDRPAVSDVSPALHVGIDPAKGNEDLTWGAMKSLYSVHE